jgi:hypothetical protein
MARATGSDQRVFHATNQFGEVWIHVDLTRQRLDEPFVPIAVAVRNTAGSPITLTRSSFTALGRDGVLYGVPEVSTLRATYRKGTFDREVLRLDGIPFGTKLTRPQVRPSNFFPSLARGEVARDHVVLPDRGWTADLIYFPRPVGLAEGQQVQISVQPEGWEAPVTTRIQL